MTLSWSNTHAQINGTDVRVLVDVSGSMKQADPKSVRGQATALLAALLPENSRAGIWLFGSTVRELVPYGSVDSRWNALSKPIETSIGSTDQFTNMEKALSAGLEPSTKMYGSACHTILITDGIVDVQGGKDASLASRDRILESILPNASKKGCKIHTIALSEKADLPLLRQMALETDGLFSLINRPGDLIPVMLDALDLALRSQQLPVRDGHISIDNTIRQVRVIRLGDNTEIELASNTRQISKKTAKSGQDWYEGRGYQTLIWSDPVPDSYRITNALGPKDRILIDTDVILETPELPSTIIANQTLGLTAFLSKGGEPINNPNREFRVSFGDDLDPKRTQSSFLQEQIDSPTEGRAVLTIQSFDKNYQRQIQRAFEVLKGETAPEIAQNTAKAVPMTQEPIEIETDKMPEETVAQMKSNVSAVREKPGQLLNEIQNQVTEIVPKKIESWPIWQIIAVALVMLVLLGFVFKFFMKPKHK